MLSNALPFTAFAVSGTALLVYAALSGQGRAGWCDLTVLARILIAFICLVPAAQLVPLPPTIWQSLPGRDLATAALAAAGAAQEWRPIALDINAALRILLVTLWLTAFLLVALRVSTTEMRRLFRVLLVLGFVNVLVGVVQIASGNTALDLHGVNWPFLNGLFANKNHASLFIAVTFLAGYVTLYAERGWDRRTLAIVLPIGLLLFAALLATFSRAGIVLGAVTVVGLVAAVVSGKAGKRTRMWIAALGLIAIVVLALASSSEVATRSLARFGDVGDDLRWRIWQWSWPMVGTYFPVGGGIGSFLSLFPPHEQLAWVKPTYVNHAHNDYMELLIEIGAAAPIGWVLVIAALYRPVRAAWMRRGEPGGRMALIGIAILILIAAHSVVDYPLRRPSIAVTAMLALAAVLRMAGPAETQLRGGPRYARREGE